ncbi:MAG TPA: type II toxin-antitoxin system Phd/YefM family antitoxin [Thermoanaerobaculia bacterium]|jgi:prevent-host-death family protein|nr:type II toxin-antitoxin system Phd/YefM family antitoxin [Thermoanaerobaculia bacterium]
MRTDKQLETISRRWPVQEAKARFSELLEASLKEGPQIVTRRGVEAAVIVPVEEWRRLQDSARPTLKELLLAESARARFSIPARRQWRRRRPMAIG